MFFDDFLFIGFIWVIFDFKYFVCQFWEIVFGVGVDIVFCKKNVFEDGNNLNIDKIFCIQMKKYIYIQLY